MAHRSPNYPAIGLSEAIEKVCVIFSKDHTTATDPLVLVGHVGYAKMHGPARSLISALRKYGLM